MKLKITPDSLRAAVPEGRGDRILPGLEGTVSVFRCTYGIPHMRAVSEHDAFFAQGFVHAQDRLWQMEYDRRRAEGRWAEVAGPDALEGDRQMCRFRIHAHLPAILEALAPDTRGLLEAYAGGVNAFLSGGEPRGIEFQLAGIDPAPWTPLDSLAVFTVRHILMGVWESKIWRARMLTAMGAEKVAAFHPGYQRGQPVIVPPGEPYLGSPLQPYETLAAGLSHLTFMKHGTEDGSNNWVVGGARTATGKPLLAGDPHRALDIPNVYYQNHLACDAFDVVGFSFPGVPGFPHFAHNARVAWGITHGSADYQDLFIERFEGDPPRYEYQGEWLEPEHVSVVIPVRGEKDALLDTWATRHGPIVGGDPRAGHALAFRYTAMEAPNGTLDAVRAMLLASNADELEEACRDWVDPVNNLVYFDLDGNFGYRTRGALPVRGEANAWTPVPGWTGGHEWEGRVPFEEMPSLRNPPRGFAYSANNRIVDDSYPHFIGLDFAPGFRAERINENLKNASGLTVEDMADLQGDRLSVPALEFKPLYDRIPAPEGKAAGLLEVLRGWDCQVQGDAAGPLVFAAFRRCLMRRLLEPEFDPRLLAEIFVAVDRGANGLLTRTQARLHTLIAGDDPALLPSGENWTSLMSGALRDAAEELHSLLGPEPSSWRWDSEHHTAAAHMLSPLFPEAAPLLDPPSIRMGGDGDTVQAGGYYAAQDFRARFISVARYIFDGADWDNSRWIVPTGASGHPGSDHYADQLPLYEKLEYLPMTYTWEAVEIAAKTIQSLRPE